MTETLTKPMTEPTDRERQQELADQIEEMLNRKPSFLHPFRNRFPWKVESQSEYRAVMVEDRRCPHIVHLVFTILTAGIWVIVWVINAIQATKPKRQVLTV